MWYILIAFLLYLIILSVSTAVLCKKAGYADWKQAFIPLWSFRLLYRLTGEFKVFSIPMKKYFETTLIYTLLFFACIVGFVWGKENLSEKSYGYFQQIVYLPFIISLILFDFSIYFGAEKVYTRFHVKKTFIIRLLTLLLIPVPFIFLAICKNEVRKDEEMF